MNCTIKKYLKIVEGTIADYKPLSRFHYRDCKTGPIAAVYKIIDTHPMRSRMSPIAGVIIYSMPTCRVQLRNVATGGLFNELNSESAMQLVNRNIRTISRVVIEPRYRNLGLAYELVKKTMPLLQMPYIEALAVMGKVNPFFEKASMTKFEGPIHPGNVKMLQALSVIGIEEDDLIDIEKTHSRINSVKGKVKDFIEKQIQEFFTVYGKRARTLPNGLTRTEYLISRLTDRPVYYLWRNAEINLKI
ncbi:MAG: hypothetical protein JW806_01320 [Sedimentisphaerales bacterium]|nr:hypothetical protein [Sedimentisphaerales bacterium]